jgi:hypothetical protein
MLTYLCAEVYFMKIQSGFEGCNFCLDSEVHGLNTRSKNQFYIPTSNLSASRSALCLLVLGYLIDCQGPFRVVERIESVLKIIYFHVS